MFANTFQSGFLSIFYSVGSSPLQLWDKQVKNGHIRRVVDDEVKSLVLEISGTNVATTFITCPIKPRLSLGIRLPFLVMIIKNMKKYFTFEIQILDDKDMHRRFRVSNFQSTTKVRPFCTTMPIGLSSGWNQVQFNLADFTKRAYGSTYVETTRVQIHANVRIRRIYFSDMLYSDDELPNEYKLFVPTPGTQSAARPSKTPSQQKKPSGVGKLSVSEKKESKKLSAAELQIQLTEQEIPSGAPPSPAGLESPAQPVIPPTSEPLSDISEVPEPPSEGAEMPTTATTEPETEEFSDATDKPTELLSEVPSEAPAETAPETEAKEETPAEAPQEPAAEGETPATEGETPAETPTVEEAAPPAEPAAEETPTEKTSVAEAPPAEESAPEAPVEEAAPTEEAPQEEPPAEEAQAEVPAEEEPAPAEET